MFLQQTFASVGKVLPAVIAPLVLAELDADPAWIGIYYGLAAAASLVAQMGCGSFIVRYGALRMSQVALVLLGGGMAVAAEGSIPGFAASAIVGGGGAAVSTPTSSQLLGRVSPPRLAPLVFSIKQTAVPTGLLISGFWPRRWPALLDGGGRHLLPGRLASPSPQCCSRCERASTTTECLPGASGCRISERPLRRF
jgi:MFS family permease